MGGLFLNGMFGLHVQLLRHLIAIVSKKIIVQRLVVTRNRASYRSGVGGKYCSNLRNGSLQIKCSHACHPLMRLKHHFIRFRQIIPIETLHHLSGGICKHGGFIIVTVCMQGVHLIVFPHFRINFILLCKERLEINQYDNRLTRNIPAAYADREVVFFNSIFLPCGTKVIGLDK